jgi:predicted dehydrogenase
VDTEDVACLVFRASGDILGTLTVSQVAAGRKNRIWIEIEGQEASVVFNEERPDQLWIGHRQGNELLLRDPAALSPEARRVSVMPAGHHEGFVDNFAAFLRDVYGAVVGTEPHRYPSFVDGARSACITEAVLRSSTEHTWAKVES